MTLGGKDGVPAKAPAKAGQRVAVIAGAGGVVGASLANKLVRDGWSVIGLSRRPLDRPGVKWLGVDLTDRDECNSKLGQITDATHLFCTARFDFGEGGREPLEENLAIVRNALEVLEKSAPDFQHIHLVQGMKYYGSHIGPFPTPAKEDQPRSLVPNFYYLQQDYVADRQKQASWTWSASRPDAMLHALAGVPRSMVSVVAVYALICRELGQPFSFPGSHASFDALYQCTSVDQLAAGIQWMSETPSAANEAYNLTNGDFIRWANLWPVFARFFGVEPGPVRSFKLSEAMIDKAPVWDRIVERYGLRPSSFETVANWKYADYIWSREWDVMADMTKARIAGFHRAVETSAEFCRYFEVLRAQRIVA